jgi:tRNA dimethylallyltransferase
MSNKLNNNILTILGPTATGKTTLAAHLAARLGGEVISADSRQVYRGMDIGTGKDMEDYLVNGVRIPVHLTDLADAGNQYNLYEYQRDFLKVWRDLEHRKKFPVLCGGSGLYLEAVLKNYRLVQVPLNEQLRSELTGKTLEELTHVLKSYNSKLHNITDTVNEKRAIRAIEIADYYQKAEGVEQRAVSGKQRAEGRGLRAETKYQISMRSRVPDSTGPNTEYRSQVTDYPILNPLIVGIYFDRDTRRERITQRLHQRLNEGMIEEVKMLLDKEIPPEDLIYYGLEYKFITLYLTGMMAYREMVEKLNIAIHQFAKRQMTWFRKMEREGTVIHWIDGRLPLEEKVETVLKLLTKSN